MCSKIGRPYRFCSWFCVALLFMAGPLTDSLDSQSKAQVTPNEESFHSLDDILHYISLDWDRLSRSLDSCETFFDSKTDGEPVLYLPVEIESPARSWPACPSAAKFASNAFLKRSRRKMRRSSAEIHDHGLLFLKYPYVVPGGQFNEMYGWDSYFIVRGLLEKRSPRSGARYGREFLLRNPALRRSAERQSHLLSRPVAAPIPQLDDSSAVSRRRCCRAGPCRMARQSVSIRRLRLRSVDPRTASRGRYRAFPVFRRGRWARAGNHGRSERTTIAALPASIW